MSPPAFGPNISEWLPCTVCSPFFQCPLALVILFLLQTCIRAPKITLYIFSEIICMPNLFFFIKKIIHDAPHTVATVCQVVEIDCDVCNFYLKLSCKIHIVHLIIFQIYSSANLEFFCSSHFSHISANPFALSIYLQLRNNYFNLLNPLSKLSSRPNA